MDGILACMFKMTHQTRHFNKNQKVWLGYMSGQWAYLVVGKFRGKGRYVAAWVKYNETSKPQPNVIAVAVTKKFDEQIQNKAWACFYKKSDA